MQIVEIVMKFMDCFDLKQSQSSESEGTPNFLGSKPRNSLQSWKDQNGTTPDEFRSVNVKQNLTAFIHSLCVFVCVVIISCQESANMDARVPL